MSIEVVIDNCNMLKKPERPRNEKIEARKWYTIMLGYGGSESHAFAAVEKTGRMAGGSYSMFSGNGGGMLFNPMRPVWRMIDEQGYEMTATDNDLQSNGAIGIGSLVPCNYEDLPDLTDERLAELVALGKENQRKAEEEAARAKQERENCKREFLRKYSYLPNRGEYISVAKVAQNLRTELKRTFPGVKFSVRSKDYSGGDSIDVSWEDGPMTHEVKRITCKYVHSSTDYTGDYRDYTPSAFNDVFGGTKYLFTERTMSDATAKVVWDGLADNDWDAKRERGKAFNATSLPVGAIVTGSRDATEQEINALHEAHIYGTDADRVLTFDVPAPKANLAAVAKSARSFAGAAGSVTVEVTENIERNGVEIRFSSRPEQGVIDKLKANGWRWTRFGGCWYNRACDAVREFAREIAGMNAAVEC